MADSAVAITAGTGTSIDTRTEATNGHHRQVVVLGDPATNAGVAPVDATAGLKVDLGADNDITGTVTANLGATDNAVLDAIAASVDTIDSVDFATQTTLAAIKAKTDNIPALGQALAAGSVPVILPSATITTLTPPAAITGFATAANQLADGHNVTVDNSTGAAAVNIQDGGNTITVDGTVAVTNAALTELAAAINTDKLDVNIVSSDVATGGTSAADDADFTAGTTAGTPAQGVYESTPTSVTDGDLGTVGITSGRRLKTSATVDAALPAGTNAIGKLAANSGVDIGDVDVTSSALPTGASTSAKQDTIIGHVDGIEALLTTIDSDTSNLAVVGGGLEATAQRVTIANDSTGVISVDDNGGALTVDGTVGVSGTVTVDGSGVTQPVSHAALTELAAAINSNLVDVNIVSGAGSGGTAQADDADFTAGTTQGTPAQGVYESTPTTVTDGDLGTVGITSDRRLKTSAVVTGTVAVTQSGTWDEVGINDSGNSITVDGTVTADLGATDNAVLDAIAASTAAIETAVEGTLTVTGGGGGTEYTEDVATANPIVGTATMIERDDVLSTVTPIEGDNIGLRGTAEGALWTQDFNSDAILADTTAILADTAAIEIATEATQAALETAGGLVVNLGANNDVTVTGSVTADLGANNDVTVTGTVDLGATDNAVLDTIDAVLDTINTKLVTGTDIGDVTINNSTGAAAVNIQDGGNTITVDGAVTVDMGANNDVTVTSGTITTVSSVTAIANALPAGTNAIGKLAANSGVDIGDVDVTSIAAGTNSIGNVGLVGRTSGGMSIFRSIDIDETEEEVKATAGQVFSITAFNHTAAPIYLKFYNLTAANTTVGTSTPVLTFTVPGNADSDGAGFIWNNDIGFAFGTAISVAATTAIADADTGAPAANACSVNIGYA